MALQELERSHVPQLEDTDKYSLIFYYNEQTEADLVKEVDTLLEQNKDDSVLSNAYWFKSNIHPETINYIGASIANVIGIDLEGEMKNNLCAVMLGTKGKKFMTSLKTPLDKEALKTWLASVQDGTAKAEVRSEPRPPNDEYPGKKGLKKLVATAFDEIVLDSHDKDVFVDIYADWCGPCIMVGPMIEKVANVLQPESGIVICKMNSDLNDYSDELFPEGTIPNMKLFPAGDKEKKNNPIKFSGKRSAAGILAWIHENATNKFDLDKYLPDCKKFDDFFLLKMEAEEMIQEVKNDLDFVPESSTPDLENLLKDLEKKIDEEEVGDVTNLLESLKISTDREQVKQAADKKRLGNVVKIHNMSEFDEALKHDKLVVVDFTASWCGPCQFIGPIFAAMSSQYADAKFLKVDVDECQDVALKCGIEAMPTFQFFKNGSKIAEIQGADPEGLDEAINKHL
ncbi:hypothetical protein C9374_014584 [Naegleria lovaniensis]|uniref:Thioredoxin domain-containing protein n=1 Tax=Naegleria lovaniensis TaxID=51637 RepID=A0AA88KPJ2_NAELO|nr:uncharacterized protein C9374_014584 [Naegleria lovaniensis]KAG2389184.1 hypothetical protein C9374_014584 [Naegleria lovaniensis]